MSWFHESIIEKGYAAKPYIGVYAETINQASASEYGVNEGIGINSIMAGGPAEKVGLKAGDAIIEIDGKKVTSVSELKSNISRAGIGGKLSLKIVRDGKEMLIDVNVEEDTTS